MSSQIAILRDGGIDLEHLMRFADLIGKSGMFKAKSAEEVATKILWGASAGLDPVVSVQGIDVIQGSPAPSGGLIASLLDRHPRYAYQPLARTNERCDIAFYAGTIGAQGSPFVRGWNPEAKPWEGLKPGVSYRGTETFTLDDAKLAGLTGKSPWKCYPRAMLFNRAISDGRRTFAPDLFGGGKGYTPEELGAEPPREDTAPEVHHVTVAEAATYVDAEYEVAAREEMTQEEADADHNAPAKELREPVMVAEQEMLF